MTNGDDTNLIPREGDTLKKLLGKTRWEGKLFPKEQELVRDNAEEYQLTDDVVEFLKPSTDRAARIPARRPVGPKLDLQAVQAWAEREVAKQNQNIQPDVRKRSGGQRARRKAQNLRVTFAMAAPEIISYGGHNAGTPPAQVSNFQKQMQAPKVQRLRPAAGQDVYEVRGSDTGHWKAPYQGSRQLPPSHEGMLRDQRPNLNTSAQSAPEMVPGGADLGKTTPGSFLEGKSQASTSLSPRTYSLEGPHISQRSRLTMPLDGAKSARVVVGLPRDMSEEGAALKVPRQHLSPSPDIETERNTSFNQHMVDKPSPDQPLFKPSANALKSYANPRAQTKLDLSSALDFSSQARNGRTCPYPLTSHKLSTLAAISQAVSSGRNISLTAPPSQPQSLALGSEEALVERESSVSPSRQSPFSAKPVSRCFPDNPALSDADLTGSTSYFPLSNLPIIESKPRPQFNTAQEPHRRISHVPGSNNGSQGPQQSFLEVHGDVAWFEFVDRMVHLKRVFKLTADFERSSSDLSASDWARAGLWWFLKGRSEFEALVRRKLPIVGSRHYCPQEVHEILQAHVDIAKAWWISTEILQLHLDVSVAEEEAASTVELRSTTRALTSAMKALVISMTRNHPFPFHQSLAQGCDTSIWIRYPAFAPDIWSCFSANPGPRIKFLHADARSVDPLQELPLGDTENDFCYGRAFVLAFVATEDPDTCKVSLPCVLTILRGHLDWTMKLRLSSQNGLVRVCVSSDQQSGPTWEEVQWRTKSQSMHIRLPRGFALRVQFEQADFQMLREMYDCTRKVEATLHPASDERTVYEVKLRDIRYQESSRSPTLPLQRLRKCRARIFERIVTTVEAAGRRSFHRGYRLCIATSTRSKQLSSLSHVFGKDAPMVFELVSGSSNEALPVLKLSVKEETRFYTIQMTFSTMNELEYTYRTLNGMSVQSDETSSACVELKGLSIEPLTRTGGIGHSCLDPLKAFQWQFMQVINEARHNADNGAKTVLAERLRVVMRHTSGSITDRINLGPGELRLRLPVGIGADLVVIRAPQEDMAVSVNASAGTEGIPDALERLLQTVRTSPTIRTFSFHSLTDLHVFEEAMTGFHVGYDGTATAFTISRRRMVVPIHKTWTAGFTRIQVVQQSTITQLLAFFSDFSHGQCMSFQIKSHDIFEKVDKGGKYWAKLVDAKFPLPCGGEGEQSKSVEPGDDDTDAARQRTMRNAQANGSVCVDSPEWPSECDDIMVGFGNEAERDRFVETLPAPAQAHRALTFRRRI